MFKLGKASTRNLETLLKSKRPESEKMVKLVKEFIKITTIDFCILKTGGLRTAKQQKVLFKKGYSQLDGYKYKSRHQLGLAVDLVPWVRGKASWGTKECFLLAGEFKMFCLMQGVQLISGADFNNDGDLTGDSWDPCHHELVV
jgi:peptidoglycan L-alanyl-D-glutamate endopeptidase CwlK